MTDRIPPELRNPPNAALYFDCPDTEESALLFDMWIKESLAILRSLFGTDWPGKWFVAHTLPDFRPGAEIHQTDATAIIDLLGDSIQGHVALIFKEAEQHNVLESVRLRLLRRPYGGGHYLMLHQSIGLTDLVPESRDRFSSAIVAMMEHVAVQKRPLYGEATPTWGGHEPHTRLDLLMHRTDDTSMAEASGVLRGYEWLTVCPGDLATKIGGAVALRASGAFARIVELPHSLILQATDHPHQFDETAAYRVWQVLRPILPIGQPKPIPLFDFSPLVLADAAQSDAARERLTD